MKKEYIYNFISFLLHCLIIFLLIKYLIIEKYKPNKNTISIDVKPQTVTTNILPNINSSSKQALKVIEKTEKKQIEKPRIRISRPDFQPEINQEARDFDNIRDKKFSIKTKNRKINVFDERLKVHGAKEGYEKASIQATLSWDTKDDLDLEAHLPSLAVINYSRKRARGGFLDVDKNVVGSFIVKNPIENIYWLKLPRPGFYRFYVSYPRLAYSDEIAYELRLKLIDKYYFFSGKVNKSSRRYLITSVKVINERRVVLEKNNYKAVEKVGRVKNKKKILFDKAKIILDFE